MDCSQEIERNRFLNVSLSTPLCLILYLYIVTFSKSEPYSTQIQLKRLREAEQNTNIKKKLGTMLE